jgi:AmmeMemoRadiSam system protein A
VPGALTDGEQRSLLWLARATLEAHFAGEPLPEVDGLTPSLSEPRGAFVTLTEGGALRGCIGHVVATLALWRTVRDNALAAALRDPRFPPVTGGQLSALEIEISALSPLLEIDDESAIEVGHHGLMLECRGYRGLLLPQVATAHGWDRQTFLDHTCRKAGLRAGCWRDPAARLSIFSADVFSE